MISLIKLLKVFSAVLLISLGNIKAENKCGNWESYKDEKCFKVLDQISNEGEAEVLCKQQGNESTIITIHSKEEQDFLEKLLFTTHKIVDNVWIGLKYNTKFSWIDDTQLDYTNWDSKSPKNKTSDGCVEVMADEGSIGKWSDVPCNKRNMVACQKMQIWSNDHLQKRFLQMNKRLIQLEKDNEKLIPIGFIYVQLHKEKSPGEIWPSMKWTEISSSYEGVFFRVVGKNAEAFGTVQNENIPVHYIDEIGNYYTDENIQLYLDQTGWSKYIWSGSSQGTNIGLRYHVNITTSEIRPRNMAVKIWKKTG